MTHDPPAPQAPGPTPAAADGRFRPSVTVAAVIHRPGPHGEPEFLLVEEHTPEGLRLNQPAGHLEPGESLVDAVVREALEETAHAFVPQAFTGVYLARFQRERAAADGTPWRQDVTYLRVAFAGTVGEPLPGRTLDDGIVRALWLPLAAVRDARARHRSPLVMRCIDDHLAGRALPLDALVADPTVWVPRRWP